MVSLSEKNQLIKAKKIELQNILHDRDLLIDQKMSVKKLKEVEKKIDALKNDIKNIEKVPITSETNSTIINMSGGTVGQMITGQIDGEVVQIINDFTWDSDKFDQLEKELSAIHIAMKTAKTNDDQDIEIGEIVKAKKAAKEKNKEGLFKAIQATGKWTLDFAIQVGATLVAEIIKLSWG
jgi:hypothetical protein